MPAMNIPTHPDELAFLARLDEQPLDAVSRGAYADWLDEHDRPVAAAALRAAWLGWQRYEPFDWTTENYAGPCGVLSAGADTDGLAGQLPAAGDVLCGLLVRYGPDWLYLPRAIVSETRTEVSRQRTAVRVLSVGPFKVVRDDQVVEAQPA
jgi:uncharacterized protein (TIGR02996 family)